MVNMKIGSCSLFAIFCLLKKYQFDKSILLNNLIITTYELIKKTNITYITYNYYIS